MIQAHLLRGCFQIRVLIIQESDWDEKGPHQQHHIFERLSNMNHEIVAIDYEVSWRNKQNRGIFTKRREFTPTGKVVENSQIHVVRPRVIKKNILCYLSLMVNHFFEIFRQIKKKRPHIIIGWGILNTAIAVCIAKLFRIPTVYYVIDSLHTLIPESYFQRFGHKIEQSIANNADHVVVINQGLSEYIERMGVSKSKISVVSAGVDLNRMNPSLDGSPIREKHSISIDDIVLFFMGTMFDFSGLIELANSLLKDDSKAEMIKLLLLGRGNAYPKLKKLSETPEAKGRIILVDWVPYHQVPLYIASADFCLLPAQNNEVMSDIVPIKMYEYLASGKPVVSTKLPGIQKEFGFDNGVIYVESPEDVIETVLELASTPEEIKRIGASAINFVEPLDWFRLVRKFERLMFKIVQPQ